jgi:hypothetical protein
MSTIIAFSSTTWQQIGYTTSYTLLTMPAFSNSADCSPHTLSSATIHNHTSIWEATQTSHTACRIYSIYITNFPSHWRSAGWYTSQCRNLHTLHCLLGPTTQAILMASEQLCYAGAGSDQHGTVSYICVSWRRISIIVWIENSTMLFMKPYIKLNRKICHTMVYH